MRSGACDLVPDLIILYRLMLTFNQDSNIKRTLDIKFPGQLEFAARNNATPIRGGILPRDHAEARSLVSPTARDQYSEARMVPHNWGVPNMSDSWKKDIKSDEMVNVGLNDLESRYTGIPLDVIAKQNADTTMRRMAIDPSQRPLAAIPDATAFTINPGKLLLHHPLSSSPDIGAYAHHAPDFFRHIYVPYYDDGLLTPELRSQLEARANNAGYDNAAYTRLGDAFLGASEYNGYIPLDENAARSLARALTLDNQAGQLPNQFDTAKHEFAHIATMPYPYAKRVYGVDIPFVGEFLDDAKATINNDHEKLKYYDGLAPTHAYRENTYYGEHPAEAWGSAHRVKKDASGLFYKATGRIPGFYPDGTAVSQEQKAQDIKLAMDMYYRNYGNLDLKMRSYLPDASYHTSVERKRDTNQHVPDGKEYMRDWMLAPLEELAPGLRTSMPDTLMWDIAHLNNNYGDLTVKMANINGLVKAANKML